MRARPPLRGRSATALMAALGALALAACSDDDPDRAPAASGPKEVRTTRVEVVEGLGRKGAFDPAALYRRLAPGVVTVLSLFDGGGEALLRDREDDGNVGQGSGFLLDGDGYVATNAHVVSGDESKGEPAKEVYVEFSDGNRVSARIVGTDPNADVALLKIPTAGLRFTPLRLGRSRDITVGQPVAAIGSPFGERQSLSVGVISALDRNISSLTAFDIGNAIQTDAAINPGNSGGPLLSGSGRVLGMSAQIKSTSGGGEGVGFAVPVDTVRRSLRALRREGHVDYGYLGVTSQPLYPQLARRLGVGASAGALIAKVEDGSPADRAGLDAGDAKIEFQGQEGIPAEGDVILAVAGRRLTRANDLADLISAHDSRDTVALSVFRDGRRRTVKVRLGTRPERRSSSERP